MKKIRMLMTIALVGSMGCNAQGYPDDKHFQAWRIGAAISYEFPSGVLEAYGVNEKEDWTSMMLPYGNLVLQPRLTIENYRRYTYPEYDGNVLPLTGVLNFTPNQLGIGKKSLPDQLYVYWRNTLTNYATVVDVTPQIKAAMVKPYTYQSGMFKGQSCYQTDFIFGLLPDGRAKLWLRGCLLYTYLGEYQPTKIMPPKDPSLAKNKPIPWDKVNQVWHSTNHTMQNLEDVVQTDSNGRITYVETKPTAAPVVEVVKPQSRCWADKPASQSIKLSKDSAEYQLLRLFWNHATQLMYAVSKEHDDSATVLQAWQEGKQNGLSDNEAQVWVLARLVTLADYSLTAIIEESSLSESVETLLKQYMEEMCDTELQMSEATKEGE